jgi:hypothetical protein
MDRFKAIFSDLLARLFKHWQSSATGLGLLLVTFLQDHGVTLSQSNQSALVAKVLLLATIIAKLLGKDAGKAPEPPGEDPGSGSGPTTSGLNRLTRGFVMLLIGVTVLTAQTCNKQTTLDRVGAVVVASVSLYGTEIDNLKSEGLIDDAKYERLKKKAKALDTSAADFSRALSEFGAIGKGNAPAFLQKLGAFTRIIETALTDVDLGGISETSKPVNALRYGRATLNAASLVVAGLFPPTPPQAGPVTASGGTVARTFEQRTAQSQIKVTLPKPE